MHTDLTVFRMAHAMAVHAGKRQAVIAENVANADTPGFRARDIASFADQLRSPATAPLRAELTDAPADANGNSVSLELELLKSVDTKRQHDRAIMIYRSSLNILRGALGR